MEERISNDLSTIIAQAFEQMKKREPDFSFDKVNLAELSRLTGISRQRLKRLKRLGFRDVPVRRPRYEEYVKNKGIHPDSGCRWEDATTIRRRVLPVLQKYADVPKVIVIGHEMMIEAVTGVPHPNCGEIVPFSLVGNTKNPETGKISTRMRDKSECPYSKGVRQERIDSLMADIIVHVVNDSKFREDISARIGKAVDTSMFETQIEKLSEQIRYKTKTLKRKSLLANLPENFTLRTEFE